MDLEAQIKLIGTAIGAITGLITFGEKVYKWGKSAYESLKKMRESNQSGNKKVYGVELKPKVLKKINNVATFEASIDLDLRMICLACPPLSSCVQSIGRLNRS